LTHLHGRDAALGTPGIDEAVIYPGKGDFSFRRAGRKVTGRRRFDHLVIPFSNCSGAGFENVVAMAFRIRAEKRWTLPLNGRLKTLRFTWWLRFPALLGMKAVSFAVTFAVLPFLLIYLLVQVILSKFFRQRKETEI